MRSSSIADAIAATSIEWTLDAIKATGDAGVKGWRYTQATLDRWQRDGRQATPSKNGNDNTPSGPLNPAEIAASNAAYGARIRENSPPVVYPEGWLEKESARNLKMLEEKYGVFEGDTGKASTNGHKVAGLSRRVLPEVQALPPASNS